MEDFFSNIQGLIAWHYLSVFHCLQSHQEKTYQEYMATKAKERANQLEQYYEQVISRTSTELSSILAQIFH